MDAGLGVGVGVSVTAAVVGGWGEGVVWEGCCVALGSDVEGEPQAEIISEAARARRRAAMVNPRKLVKQILSLGKAKEWEKAGRSLKVLYETIGGMDGWGMLGNGLFVSVEPGTGMIRFENRISA